MKTYSSVYKKKKLKAWLDITTHCNARCPQCHRTNPKTGKKADWLPLMSWSTEQFKTAFPKKDLEHICKVNFCGTNGDPIMAKEIFEICEYIINNSDTEIVINTNGSIRDEFWWRHLGYIMKDRGEVFFDIDGSTQEMHELYRQNTDLDKILKNMKAYSLYGRVGVLTIVFKHNENDFENIHKLVEDTIGKDKEFLHLFIPSDRAHHIDKFKFYVDGELKILEHSPKYGLSAQRTIFNWSEYGRM
jgi:MoaA/NifB/PqqE/SkfB family radical SAM enzyme